MLNVCYVFRITVTCQTRLRFEGFLNSSELPQKSEKISSTYRPFLLQWNFLAINSNLSSHSEAQMQWSLCEKARPLECRGGAGSVLISNRFCTKSSGSRPRIWTGIDLKSLLKNLPVFPVWPRLYLFQTQLELCSKAKSKCCRKNILEILILKFMANLTKLE